jgi:hypothetical protein
MSRVPTEIAIRFSISAASAYALAWACGLVLTVPAALVAASFIVNLALLCIALALLPDGSDKRRWMHIRGIGRSAWLSVGAYLGLWLYGVWAEGPRVFVALAAITIAQTSALAAVNAIVETGGGSGRLARTSCGVLLALSAAAFLWTRPPILNAGSPEASSRWTSAVMWTSPPAGVAAAWYSESDAALDPQTSARRFDLVRAPMNYMVWIGSYEAVAYPEILPRGLARGGLAAWLLCFALPVLLACDGMKLRRFT